MRRSEIFLECRLTIPSNAKTFCGCSPGVAAGNCPFCRGDPRAAPSVNRSAVECAYTLADELDCALLAESAFEKRKNMPPVPAKYRLSGLSLKTAENGFMEIQFHRRKKRVRITEVRIEEYAGRTFYASERPAGTHGAAAAGSADPSGNAGLPFVTDYSRAGCPCILIRTAADFETGAGVEIFLSELERRVRYIGLHRMFRAAGTDPSYQPLRCDAYVGVAENPCGRTPFVKLRDLDSPGFLRKAVDAEIQRQEEIVSSGGRIQPESFVWNPGEEAMSFYRVDAGDFSVGGQTEASGVPAGFHCPPALISSLKASVSEHPSARRDRFMRDYGVPWRLADFVCAEKDRADFLDQSVALGAPPLPAARLTMSDVVPLMRRHGADIRNSPLSPKRFASVLKMYTSGEIHIQNLRPLLSKIVETDGDPAALVDENGWRQLCDAETVASAVKKAVEENPSHVARLRSGDASALRFLTERVAASINMPADVDLIKRVLRDETGTSVCAILSMGGTISGVVQDDGGNSFEADGSAGGEVHSGDAAVLAALAGENAPGVNVSVESVLSDNLMSEEIQPADWASLISCVCAKIVEGNTTGIVIAHGTDTLAFTAPLVYWLFGDAPVPIVLTASSAPPRRFSGSAGTSACEAAANLKAAVELARVKKKGVYVVFGGRTLSPVNLKFTSPSPAGFTNWNMGRPVFQGQGLLSDYESADPYIMGRLLSDAADRMHLCRIFPGLRSGRLLALVEEGVTDFFLEVYGRGTGSMKDSSYSLKDLLIKGGKKGCRFYCTSQQECDADFSGCATSRRLWREGLIPMGRLTTETAIALYFAASLVCDSPGELLLTMETAAACI